jgi:hypothetical protein
LRYAELPFRENGTSSAENREVAKKGAISTIQTNAYTLSNLAFLVAPSNAERLFFSCFQGFERSAGLHTAQWKQTGCAARQGFSGVFLTVVRGKYCYEAQSLEK